MRAFTPFRKSDPLHSKAANEEIECNAKVVTVGLNIQLSVKSIFIPPLKT